MKSWSKTIEFNEENSLYKILHEYYIENKLHLYGKKEDEISKKLIRTLIFKQGALINTVNTNNDTDKLKNGDRVQVPSIGIDFTCVENKKIKKQ